MHTHTQKCTHTANKVHSSIHAVYWRLFGGASGPSGPEHSIMKRAFQNNGWSSVITGVTLYSLALSQR